MTECDIEEIDKSIRMGRLRFVVHCEDCVFNNDSECPVKEDKRDKVEFCSYGRSE